MKVYDENVKVEVIRKDHHHLIPFSEIKKGDEVVKAPRDHFIAGNDAHLSGDSDYDGWLVYDESGNDYYPEDFGAVKKETSEMEAVFIQFRADQGVRRADVIRMLDLLHVAGDREVAFLQVEGDYIYAVGVILDAAFERLNFNARPDTPYCIAVRDVLNDVELESADQMYDFCGIRTMITYSKF